MSQLKFSLKILNNISIGRGPGPLAPLWLRPWWFFGKEKVWEKGVVWRRPIVFLKGLLNIGEQENDLLGPVINLYETSALWDFYIF